MFGHLQEDFNTYTPSQIRAFKGLAIAELVLFTLSMLLLLVNLYLFVYRQKTYRIYFISTFYLFSFIVFLFRLGLSVILVVTSFYYD